MPARHGASPGSGGGSGDQRGQPAAGRGACFDLRGKNPGGGHPAGDGGIFRLSPPCGEKQHPISGDDRRDQPPDELGLGGGSQGPGGAMVRGAVCRRGDYTGAEAGEVSGCGGGQAAVHAGKVAGIGASLRP